MRIVIDGAHGAGKTTFLYGVPHRGKQYSISKLGYPIFSDLIGCSFQRGVKLGVVPPKKQTDYNTIFNLIMEQGKEQYDQGCGENIFWYERGINYINVISQMDGFIVPEDITNQICSLTYDFIFVFDPIESCDFSNIHKMGCRSFTLEDRYDCVNKTIDAYDKTGNIVYRVPVFSNDIDKNFHMRYKFIKNIVKELKDENVEEYI